MFLPQAGRTFDVGEEENEHLDTPLPSLPLERDAQPMPLAGSAMEPGTLDQVLRWRPQRSESLPYDSILMLRFAGTS